MDRITRLMLPVLMLLSATSFAKGGHSAEMATHIESHKYPFELLKHRNYSGYVVYRKDTVQGSLSFKGGHVWIENGMYNIGNKYKLRDSHLHAIVLTNSAGETMHLKKFEKNTARYYRLVHKGKLTLYDRHFVFSLRPEDIDLENMRVSYNGEVWELNEFWAIGAKKKLVDVVNEVYGTNLEAKDYSKKQLIEYILKQE